MVTLGGGCFWCLEPVFEELEGVIDVIGGIRRRENYQPVLPDGLHRHDRPCGSSPDHFRSAGDPFPPAAWRSSSASTIPPRLNRQGADVGTQYRSVIFFHSPEQKAIAEGLIKEMDSSGIWDAPIVTELAPFQAYYRAEEYHQEYFKKNPYQGYCQAVIAPKMTKFHKQYAAQLKK